MRSFDHSQCYATNTHTDSRLGRQWCRKSGPASQRTDGEYAERTGGKWGVGERFAPAGK